MIILPFGMALDRPQAPGSHRITGAEPRGIRLAAAILGVHPETPPKILPFARTEAMQHSPPSRLWWQIAAATALRSEKAARIALAKAGSFLGGRRGLRPSG